MGARILIADDEPSIVTSLEFLMRHCRFDTRVASDGEEALRLASAFRPDLVLLDVMMPRLSGFEVCRRLRQDLAQSRARIVLLTAKGRDAEVREGMALGADAYVTKPFSTQELVRTVCGLLESRP